MKQITYHNIPYYKDFFTYYKKTPHEYKINVKAILNAET